MRLDLARGKALISRQGIVAASSIGVMQNPVLHISTCVHMSVSDLAHECTTLPASALLTYSNTNQKSKAFRPALADCGSGKASRIAKTGRYTFASTDNTVFNLEALNFEVKGNNLLASFQVFVERNGVEEQISSVSRCDCQCKLL